MTQDEIRERLERIRHEIDDLRDEEQILLFQLATGGYPESGQRG
jgi:hypothetical protein